MQDRVIKNDDDYDDDDDGFSGDGGGDGDANTNTSSSFDTFETTNQNNKINKESAIKERKKEEEEEQKDMLEFLFRKQNDLYKAQLEKSENKMKNLYNIKEPFDGYRIFMLSTALVHEAIELQRETNWKWWKKDNDIERNKIQDEIIDIWHFLLQLSIEAGLDSRKLIELYIKKNKENLDRQIQGY
jgi:dimeric dUTPase (all-alpha-NTP-PPase superfamily)